MHHKAVGAYHEVTLTLTLTPTLTLTLTPTLTLTLTLTGRAAGRHRRQAAPAAAVYEHGTQGARGRVSDRVIGRGRIASLV